MDMKPLSEQDIQPHSIWQSILLHLAPGVFVLIFYILALPVVINLGLPRRFASLLSIFLVLIPFELSILFIEGKKRNGRLSLQGVVVYRESIHLGQYFFWVPLLLTWSIVMFLLLAPLEDFLNKTAFSWIPEWFFASDSGFSRTILIIMVVSYGIANIAAAVVEELYFRGYLLPRLSSLKNGAPFANAALFALQHFLSPWQQVGIFLGILPQVYVVYKKQNIFIGIITHSLLNLLSSILLIISVFG